MRRCHDRLSRYVLELIDAITFDVLELDLQHARLGPFPPFPELDVANDGLERGVADVVDELAIIEALGGLYSLPQHLQIGVTPRCHIVAERIDTLARRPCLVFFDKFEHAREFHGLQRAAKNRS